MFIQKWGSHLIISNNGQFKQKRLKFQPQVLRINVSISHLKCHPLHNSKFHLKIHTQS